MRTKHCITALFVLSLLALVVSITIKLQTAEEAVGPSNISSGTGKEPSEGAGSRTFDTTATALAGGADSGVRIDSNVAPQGASVAGLERLLNSMAQAEARFEEDWKKPIAFYGKVVDQQEQPVEGANVSFVWNDLSPAGTSEAHRTSDLDGLFSLLDVTGRGVMVKVSKPGYYVEKRSAHRYFDYAREYEPFYHIPDPYNPVVFRLRKRGPGTDLITSQYGVFPELEFSTPRDGSPVWVDFFSRKVGSRGQMELSAIKPPREENVQVTGWSFRMTIPDGGFIEHNDEFPFEAPQSGYEPTIDFQFKAGESNWTELLRKQYYIAFGHPCRYGRIQIETRMFWGVRMGYVINPDGSRYLEPKEIQHTPSKGP